jgi:hypothetical protein
MAMKEKLILGAIVLLLATWFALDAVATIRCSAPALGVDL